jgi:hypothetical protein
MRILIQILVIFVPMLALTGIVVGAPHVFWASDPIAPGDTVLVTGGGFGTAPVVDVQRVADNPAGQPDGAANAFKDLGERLVSLQPKDNALKFTLPDALKPGIFAYRISGSDGSVSGLLNRPTVWWLQGDKGLSAIPGGTLRIFGKNLNSGGKPLVVLQGPYAANLAAEGDAYCLNVKLPPDLKVGDYKLFVHNGYGGGDGWSAPQKLTIEEPLAWPQTVFDVRKFDAVGDGTDDDTAAVEAALDAAGSAGGGIVYFPRGRYQVRKTLIIPRFTVLRGEREDLVNILWPDTPEALPMMLQASNSFGIEDLTFYCGNYKIFLQADRSGPDAGNILISKTRIRANVFRGHMPPDEVDKRWREGMKVGFGGGYWLLNFGGKNIHITDCDLYSSSCVYALYDPQGAVIERNIIGAGRWGGSGVFGGEGVVLADNQYVGNDLMSWGAAGGLGYENLAHVYIARNSFALEHGGDREAITSDAPGGLFCGPVVACTGTSLTLNAEIKTVGDKHWAGAGVFILNGKGMGQWRRLVSWDGTRIEVDRPWEIDPDQTSKVTITWALTQWLILNNTFTDVGISIQLYGSAQEHICAGNTTARSNGYHNFGMNYHGIQPSWYIQWLGNAITEGNAYSSGHDNYLLSGDAHLGVFALPGDPTIDDPLTFACVMRGNDLRNNAQIDIGGTDPFNPSFRHPIVQEVVAERNEVSDSDVGIFVRRASSGVLVRENKFTRVTEPMLDEVEMDKAAEERRQKLMADQGPLVAWNFENVGPRGMTDATGHGFLAAVTGDLKLVPGHSGQAGSFDGQSWLTVTEPSMFNLSDLTLALWIKPDMIKGRHGLIAKRLNGIAAPYVVSLWDGAIEFEANDTNNKWSFNFRTPALIKEGEWNHVAVVVKHGNGVTIYVNGQPVATKENALGRTMNTEPLIIGRDAWSGDNTTNPCWYHGLMDDVKIWGRALTPAEVQKEAGK